MAHHADTNLGETAMYLDNAEPSLDEMMRDPIIRLRISSAREGCESVRQGLERARARLRERARRDGHEPRETETPPAP
jgi:hypothetical protein